MRKIVLVLIMVSFFSIGAFASYNGPIISLTRSPGYAPVESSLGFKCDIYRDHIVIQKSVGPLAVTERIESNLENDLSSIIGKVSKVPQQIITGPTDSPTVTHKAFIISSNDTIEEVILKRSGHQIIKRDSQEARLLINFINAICGN